MRSNAIVLSNGKRAIVNSDSILATETFGKSITGTWRPKTENLNVCLHNPWKIFAPVWGPLTWSIFPSQCLGLDNGPPCSFCYLYGMWHIWVPSLTNLPRFPLRNLYSRRPLKGLTPEMTVNNCGFQTWSNLSSKTYSNHLCCGTGKGGAF